MPEDAAAIAAIYNEGIADRIATFETEPRTVEQIAKQLSDKGDRFPTIVVTAWHCDSVGRFAQQVVRGMGWLTKNGHPRWKLVDLDVPLDGWEQYDCVQKYLGKHSGSGSNPSASPGERNPVAEAIKGILGNN